MGDDYRLPWKRVRFDEHDRWTHERRLSFAEEIVYGAIRDAYYRTGQPLPDDDEGLRRALRMRPQDDIATMIRPVLERCFVRDGDVWRNPICDKDLAEQTDATAQYTEKQSAAGKSGYQKAKDEGRIDPVTKRIQPRAASQKPAAAGPISSTVTDALKPPVAAPVSPPVTPARASVAPSSPSKPRVNHPNCLVPSCKAAGLCQSWPGDCNIPGHQ